jgi:hypothetical protein
LIFRTIINAINAIFSSCDPFWIGSIVCIWCFAWLPGEGGTAACLAFVEVFAFELALVCAVLAFLLCARVYSTSRNVMADTKMVRNTLTVRSFFTWGPCRRASGLNILSLKSTSLKNSVFPLGLTKIVTYVLCY